jgi:UDP-N-acetyl-D-mannosaminuronic acid dehydrogenase
MNIEQLFCYKEDSLSKVLDIFDRATSAQVPVGIALVVNPENQLIGTITDGDIRRAIRKHNSLQISVAEVMQPNPIFFKEGTPLSVLIREIPAELEKRNRKSRQFLNKIVLVDSNTRPTRVLEYHQLWEQKVAHHRHLVVVGLGYVGLTMALVMADAGYKVTGVEQDSAKLKMLNEAVSYIHETGLESLLKNRLNNGFFPAQEIPEDGDVFIISVGTPVETDMNRNKVPTMSYLRDASRKIGAKLKPGNLVVLRSTVPIGTCRNEVSKILEESSGLVCGVDFYLAFAPERTAEGKALKELRNLPQIIGGFNTDSLEATVAIFKEITPTIVRVDSLEAAEMAKLMNNTYRDYVFAYANEMAKIASGFNLNIYDVIQAANKGYPRDPIPLPSPGVGGPCLTKDSHIFASVSGAVSLNPRFFVNSRITNESMHAHVAERVLQALEIAGKNLSEVKILLCGIAFKGNPETGDIRNSSALDIFHELKNKVNAVFAYDAVASAQEIKGEGMLPVNWNTAFKGIDAVLFLNNHRSFEDLDPESILHHMNEHPVLFDGWNLFRKEAVLSVKPSVYLNLSYMESSIEKNIL